MPESTFRVRGSGSLLDALQRMFEGRSRRDLRRLLHEGRLTLNGQLATSLEAPVREGDVVECARFGRPRPRALHPKVTLLHEDDDLLVVDKEVDILTTGGAPRGQRTVADVLSGHLRARGRRGRAHPCHRLDRGVSGLLAFAKSAALARQMRADTRRWLTERVYTAMVEGVPEAREGTIRSHLLDGTDQIVRVTPEDEGGKLSISHYRVVDANDRNAILEVRLETGRKNQIRVQLSDLGHPVVGDSKYGASTDPLRRIGLHARRLVVVGPRTGERLVFESAAPFALRARSRRDSRRNG